MHMKNDSAFVAPSHTSSSTIPDEAWVTPGEFVCALLQLLRAERTVMSATRVLDLACGNGIALALLGQNGAGFLCGVDSDPSAVAATLKLLDTLQLGALAEISCGDLWAPVGLRRFDIIIADLPQFPVGHGDLEERPRTSTSSGVDGRRLVDRFLLGLPARLAPGGRALMVHAGYIGVEESARIVAERGLELSIVSTTLVYWGPGRLAELAPDILARETGRTIHRYGPHTFLDLHVVAIEDRRPVDQEGPRRA